MYFSTSDILSKEKWSRGYRPHVSGQGDDQSKYNWTGTLLNLHVLAFQNLFMLSLNSNTRVLGDHLKCIA